MIEMMDQELTLPGRTVYVGDLVDHALVKLRVIQLALSPDNRGWQDDVSLFACWATIEDIIRDLEPVRERLQEPPAEEPSRQEARP